MKTFWCLHRLERLVPRDRVVRVYEVRVAPIVIGGDPIANLMECHPKTVGELDPAFIAPLAGVLRACDNADIPKGVSQAGVYAV